MHDVTFDAIVADSRLAAKLFALGAFVLLLGAAAGLNPWPGGRLFGAIASGSGKDAFGAFIGYGFIVSTLFWAARPPQRHQLLALAGWLLISSGLAFAFADSLPLGWSDSHRLSPGMFAAATMALSCLPLVAWRAARPPAPASDPLFEARWRWLALMGVLFVLVPQAALGLTSSLHPVTFDSFALHWDRAAGLNMAPWLVPAIDAVPGLPDLVMMAYGMTPLGFLACAMLHLRHKPAHVPTALLLWVGLTLSAVIAYNLFAITGPRYVFGSDELVRALASTTAQPLAGSQVPPFPRNGMPSMHFGWMLGATIVWWQSGTSSWSRALLVTMTALTAVATQYLGEHYAVDLIVAVPFVLAGIALCSTGVDWRARRGVAALGYGCWLGWVVLLRWQITAFVEHPALCWVAVAATAAVVVLQVRAMRRFAGAPATPTAPRVVATPLQRRYGAMFFASGFAALVYQVLFAKQLALTFGSTATATFTVLATFLGGMAIGSLIGGALAQRVARPLIVYAMVEVGIAVYCVATPGLFVAVQNAYVALAGGMPPAGTGLLALRVALGAAVLLVPTVLMGATLPLLAQSLGSESSRMGQRVAWLYFANTAGAALGALTAAYFVIPLLGAHRTTLVAAVLNLLVALGALELAKANVPAELPAAGGAAPGLRFDARARAFALAALGIGGLLSLGLEVLYVHLLSIVAGNSVYAFGLMVATFLIGLAVGGESARRWMLRPAADPVAGFAISLVALGACVAISAGLWNAIPEYFAGYAGYPVVRSFGAREGVRGLVCAGVMLPATIFIGASYAFAMDVVTAGGERAAALLGRAAALNTGGNIAGVLLFGFVLLPALGALDASRVVAYGATTLGLAALIWAARLRVPRVAGVAAVAVLALAAGQRAGLDYDELSTGANVYFVRQLYGHVIAHAESIDGGLTTVAQTDTPQGPVKTLLTNGKFQGNDALQGEMQAQVGFAFAPLLHTAARESALVIGYGTGVTSRVFHEAGFRDIEIAELSSDIVRLADKHFARVNSEVAETPGVHLNITDGRNMLLLTRQSFDIISLEITSIWFAGAASFYNQDFYRLAKTHLRPGGVLQQWVQLHHLTPVDILQILASVRSEFRYVSLYIVGSQGIVVATNDAGRADPSPAAIDALQARPELAGLRGILAQDLHELAGERWLDAAATDRYLSGVGVEPRVWISTDDNLRLEYSTPRANVNDGAATLAMNKELLARYRH